MPRRANRIVPAAESNATSPAPTSAHAARCSASVGTRRGPPMKPHARTSGSTVMSNVCPLSRHTRSERAMTSPTSGCTVVVTESATRLMRATSLVDVQLLMSESTSRTARCAAAASAALAAESAVTSVTFTYVPIAWMG